MTGCHKRNQGRLQTLQLNTNKAGMEGLDTVKINEIIQKASEGSKYYQHKQKCQEKIDLRIAEMKSKITKFTNEQILKAENLMTKLGSELELLKDLSKTIVHIDMDMFYAAVEMRDDPSLCDKPMAVGSKYMLSTSNYAARKFGVRAAMPGFIGKKLCPNLVIVPANFDKYKEVSSQIQTIFEEYDPQFCPMSLDEAYLDITDYLLLNEDKYSQRDCKQTLAEAVVEEIRTKIQEKTKLTASAGIASNTRLAKVCSDLNKPNGQYYLSSNKDVIQNFVKDLPIRKVSGIGNVSEQQLKGLGVTTCSDLWTHRGLLRLLFSENSCNYFMSIALGLGSTIIAPATERDCKSISNETTFAGTSDRNYLLELCEVLCADLKHDMERKNVFGKVFTLKIKTTDFKVRTRAQSLTEFTQDLSIMMSVSQKLLLNELESTNEPLSLRLIGVRMSNLIDKSNLSSKKQITLTDLFKKSMQHKEIPGGLTITNNSGETFLNNGSLGNCASTSCLGGRVPTNGSVVTSSSLSAIVSTGINLCGSVPTNGSLSSNSGSCGFILANNSSFVSDLKSRNICSKVVNSIESKETATYVRNIDSLSKSGEKGKDSTPSTSECNLNNISSPFSNNNDIYINSKSLFCSENLPSCSTKEQTCFVCPVCSIEKYYDMAELNNHIDTCLNTKVVKKLVKEVNSNLCNTSKKSPELSNVSKKKSLQFCNMVKKSEFKLKRKTGEFSRTSNKKRKIDPNSSNTLHKYLVFE